MSGVRSTKCSQSAGSLHHDLSFSTGAVESFTDEEVERIAAIVRDTVLFAAGMSFAEEVRFLRKSYAAAQFIALLEWIDTNSHSEPCTY